jgi:competence protein ComEC
MVMVAIIILLHNPFALYDIGFQFSFLGTLGIVTISNKLKKSLQKIIQNDFLTQSFSMTISAQLMIFPLIIYYFHTVSFISILANLLIVPVAGIAIMYGMIILLLNNICVPFSQGFSYCLFCLISYLLKMAELLGSLPGASVMIATPRWWVFVIYYMGIFFWRNPRYLTMTIKFCSKELLLKDIVKFSLFIRYELL